MAKTVEQVLKQYWGYDEFRSPQRAIIKAVLEKENTLALLPTGGGKSLCFQLPTLMMDGLCLVITPLIALMNDQVSQLKAKGIAAIALHSGLSRAEIDIALDNCAYGQVKFLYLSPERLQTALFIERIAKISVCLIAVDEAHCISEWGYDFRPSYLTIANLRELKPEATWIALTATATKVVSNDIIAQLGLAKPRVFQKSFSRDNISFVVRHTEHKQKQLLEILQKVKGTCIIYIRSRKNTEQLAQWLKKHNLSATFYHAGLSYDDKNKRQKAWINNEIRIMVATNAFGMGIDKADVRIVVHMDIPETLEAYYQEAGRAGRDGKRSYAVMLYHKKDIDDLREKTKQSNPGLEQIRKIYQALANYYSLAIGSAEGETFDFDIYDFCKRFQQKQHAVSKILKRLEEQEFIELSAGFYTPSRIHFLGDKKSLYTAQLANEHHNQFIKTVLRLYGAEVFSDFIVLSESQVTRALGWTPSATQETLKSLQALQLIRYEPASDTPKMTFLMARQEAKTLALDNAKIELQKKQAVKRVEAVIAYAEQSHQCRMQHIQSYFDEKTFDTCGLCDVCLEKKRPDNPEIEQVYKDRIQALLKKKSMTAEALEKIVSPKHRDQFVQALRGLLDASEIRYDKYWVLHAV